MNRVLVIGDAFECGCDLAQAPAAAIRPLILITASARQLAASCAPCAA